MKIRVFALLVSLVLTACSGQAPGPGGQPSPGKVTVQVDENRASVTVATATPAAATPSETAVAPSAKATPGDSVDVKIDASGVAVKTQAGGDGATVNITGDGVEIGTNSKGQTGSVTLTVTPCKGTAFAPGTTGSLKGGFKLSDPAGNRTASFCGMIVDDGSGPQGYGFFQLMKLPEAGPPATTLRTSPILSGNLLLQTLNLQELLCLML